MFKRSQMREDTGQEPLQGSAQALALDMDRDYLVL